MRIAMSSAAECGFPVGGVAQGVPSYTRVSYVNVSGPVSLPSLSQETILKIDELQRLLCKHPQYCTNPDAILKWAVQCSINGDNRFLDEKLVQLRSIDSIDFYKR
ncbi:MAG: hypothetical protein WAM14_12100 [Candidatus Nitrosopolaris sp.]